MDLDSALLSLESMNPSLNLSRKEITHIYVDICEQDMQKAVQHLLDMTGNAERAQSSENKAAQQSTINLFIVHNENTAIQKQLFGIDVNSRVLDLILILNPNQTANGSSNAKHHDNNDNDIQLLFNEQLLDNGKTLSEYGLQNNAVLNLKQNDKHMDNANSDADAPKQDYTEAVHEARSVAQSSNGLLFYSIKGGLHYGGVCKNGDCKAFKQQILVCRGYATYVYPLAEHANDEVFCPGCETPFTIDEFLLDECDCEIYFKYADSDSFPDPIFLSPRGSSYNRVGHTTDANSGLVLRGKTFEMLECHVKPAQISN